MSFNNKVYWDDKCYVCSLEIELLQNKNPNCNIEFIKISSLKDKTNYINEMIGEFNGIKTIGPETIRRMYDELGYHKLVKFSKAPIIKQIFNLNYKVFAYIIRPMLPKRKI